MRSMPEELIMSPPSQTNSQPAQTQARVGRDAGAEVTQPRVMFRLEESRLPRGKMTDAAKVSVRLDRSCNCTRNIILTRKGCVNVFSSYIEVKKT